MNPTAQDGSGKRPVQDILVELLAGGPALDAATLRDTLLMMGFKEFRTGGDHWLPVDAFRPLGTYRAFYIRRTTPGQAMIEEVFRPGDVFRSTWQVR